MIKGKKISYADSKTHNNNEYKVLCDIALNKEKKSMYKIQKYNFNDCYIKNRSEKRILIDFKILEEVVQDLYSYIINRGYLFNICNIVLKNIAIEKRLSSDLDIHDFVLINRFELYILFSTGIGKKSCTVHEFYDGNSEELLFNNYYLKDKLDTLYASFIYKMHGIYLDERKYRCYVSPSFIGLLVHETLGHLMEADTYLSGKAYLMDRRFNNKNINIVDYANNINGKMLPCRIYIDNQGILAKDVKIVHKGHILGKMHSLETSKIFKETPTGNARTVYKDKMFVRMRNTVLLGGENSEDEILHSIKDGVYLHIPGKGVTNKNGDFVIEVILGYTIKNGIICECLNDCIVYGNVFDCINSIDMLAENVKITGAFCNKGSLTYLGMGGPAVRCDLYLRGR